MGERSVIRVRGLTIGAGMPKIIVPLMGGTQPDLLEQARRARLTPGVDAAEWRIDFFEGDSLLDTLREVRRELGELLLLVTFRTRQEGGAREISPEAYFALNLAVAETGLADLVDVEICTAGDVAGHIEALHARGVGVIGSKHDFDKTPTDGEMTGYLERGWEVGADLPKLAVMPRSEQDVIRLLNVTRALGEKRQKPLITMSMGALGAVSRVEGERYGSAMTFGALEQASAPGQIPVEELRRELERLHTEYSEKRNSR